MPEWNAPRMLSREEGHERERSSDRSLPVGFGRLAQPAVGATFRSFIHEAKARTDRSIAIAQVSDLREARSRDLAFATSTGKTRTRWLGGDRGGPGSLRSRYWPFPYCWPRLVARRAAAAIARRRAAAREANRPMVPRRRPRSVSHPVSRLAQRQPEVHCKPGFLALTSSPRRAGHANWRRPHSWRTTRDRPLT